MLETLIILAATFVVLMAAFYLVEKWWAKRVEKISPQAEKTSENEVCNARLKFHMPKGWYCEFNKGKVRCYGVLNLPKEEHQDGELQEVKIKGFSELYDLELA